MSVLWSTALLSSPSSHPGFSPDMGVGKPAGEAQPLVPVI